jgi:hypothetical protein
VGDAAAVGSTLVTGDPLPDALPAGDVAELGGVVAGGVVFGGVVAGGVVVSGGVVAGGVVVSGGVVAGGVVVSGGVVPVVSGGVVPVVSGGVVPVVSGGVVPVVSGGMVVDGLGAGVDSLPDALLVIAGEPAAGELAWTAPSAVAKAPCCTDDAAEAFGARIATRARRKPTATTPLIRR